VTSHPVRARDTEAGDEAGAIAIVGLACRYPDADNPTQLWQNVLGQRRAFRGIPPDRLNLADYGGDRDEPDAVYLRQAALLRGWEFDRQRFRVPGALHRAADHTHWLALDTASAALADAGFPDGDGLVREQVGVVLGNSLTGEFTRAATVRQRWPFIRDAVAVALAEAGLSGRAAGTALHRVEQLVKEPFPTPSDESLAGALSNTIAGRICNHYDFHGTGYTVDGACASSLLAVMTACRALVDGELSFALAGGVDLSLDPFELVGFSRLGALAPGEMRIYDADPTGFLPGEGCGIVALMRAADAHRLDVRVYAEIIGWGSSSDGAGGLTRPEAHGQVLALRRAYRHARLDPAEAQLVEGHGTGTAVGDRVELEVLTAVRRPGSQRAALGSVKANIGHTKAAAGAAGLIKAALAAHHRVLPPVTGCRRPHELLRTPQVPLRLLGEPEPWTSAVPVAGVSSMGFGGINTHVVLRCHPADVRARRCLPPAMRCWGRAAPEHDVLLIEAHSRAELRSVLDRLAERAPLLSTAEVHDLAATMAHRAGGCAPVRCAVIAATGNGLAAAVTAAKARLTDWDGSLVADQPAGVALGSGAPVSVGLLLPGQAAPVRDSLGELGRLLPTPPRLPDGVTVTAGTTDTAVAQPAVVWQSLAGLALLQQLGCEPVAAVGHSLGELTALAWAGAISAEDVLRLAVQRGRSMAEYGCAGTGMLSLDVDAVTAGEFVGGTAAVVAAVNSPARTVIAGARADLDRVLAAARRSGVAAAELPVSHGFHGPAMLPVVRPWREALGSVSFSALRRCVISTVSGAELSQSDELADLLVEQLTSPVRFLAAVRELAGYAGLLVEAGPGTMLAGLARSCVDIPVVSMDCGGPAPARPLAMTAAALAAAGAADPTGWFAGRAYRTFDLDTPLRFLPNPCGSAAAGQARQPIGLAAPNGAGERHEPAERDFEWDARGDVVPAAGDPVRVLRERLAADLELPLAAIDGASRLLGDLHLNSLQVAQTIAKVATALGRQPPSVPLSLAEVTVADIAAAIDALPEAADRPAHDSVAGVGPWVRAFRHEWAEHVPAVTAAPVRWRVLAPTGHPLHAALSDTPGGTGATAATAVPEGLAAVVADGATVDDVAALLITVARQQPQRLLLVHTGHPAAAAIGRSVAVELPRCAVTVLDTAGCEQLAGVERLAIAGGHLELRRLGDGSLRRLVTVVHDGAHHEQSGDTRLPLQPGEVCLVTGGIAGITAHCAAELARASGAIVVALGRSPADARHVADGIDRLRVSGVPVHYLSCDITDEHAVRAAVRAARVHGPVRGLLHGAGTNSPQRMAAVTPESLRATVHPKVDGLRTVLATIGDDLRLVVGYGSIIGRAGLPGQSEYCIANDWMRVELETWAAQHPGCRTHLLEWSVWSDVGMGVRLDVLDGLIGHGVAPISPVDGSEALLQVLTDNSAPVTLLITGRFPSTPTLRLGQSSPPLLRFAENVRVHVPGVEAVIDAELNTAVDPYLDEHRVGGVAVLPAVLGMEAMVQAATVAGEAHESWSLRDVRLISPITVGERGSRTVRVAALIQPRRDEAMVALRDDADGFATDRFTAAVGRADPALSPSPSPSLRPRAPLDAEPPQLPAGPHPYYGPLLFHTGRFQRLIGYDALSAFTVRAWIDGRAAQRWFADFHAPRLLLGDPGTHDATIHVLLPCAPHHRVLPVGVETFSLWRRPDGVLVVTARERSHTATDYVFDVDLRGADGTPVASWQGLRLHVVGANDSYHGRPLDWSLPTELIGPWLTRRLIECDLADTVELGICAAEPGDGAAVRLAAALSGLSATEVDTGHCGDLVVPDRHAGVGYTDGHVLVALADRPIGVEWQVPSDPAGTDWPRQIGATRWQLAREVADKVGEEPVYAACRMAAGRDAAARLDTATEALRLDQVTEDGLVVTRGDGVLVVTARVRCALSAEPVVVALAVEER
jgi:enediyne polyketide synthase